MLGKKVKWFNHICVLVGSQAVCQNATDKGKNDFDKFVT